VLLLLLLLLWRASQALPIWGDKEVPKRWGIPPDSESGGIRLSLVLVDSHLLTGAPLKGGCRCPNTATTEALRYMGRPKQRRTYLPYTFPCSRSRYSFTDPERMEGWVSPGPGCKEQLPTVATRRPAACGIRTHDLPVAGWTRWPLDYRVTWVDLRSAALHSLGLGSWQLIGMSSFRSLRLLCFLQNVRCS